MEKDIENLIVFTVHVVFTDKFIVTSKKHSASDVQSDFSSDSVFLYTNSNITMNIEQDCCYIMQKCYTFVIFYTKTLCIFV